MTVNRNDACPCGSGKKYKKCCMKKENVIQVGQVRQERFFQAKHELTNQMSDFVIGRLSHQELLKLEKEYKSKLAHDSSEYLGVFQFWLMFFYRFPNGWRGVEWFAHEQVSRLSRDLQTMLGVWVQLVPRFIQMVDYNDEGVFVEDALTKEKLFMPYAPTMPGPMPWAGTLCLLEKMGDGYYMNGMAVMVGPAEFASGVVHMQQLLKENKQPYEQVVREHYLELVKEMQKSKDKLHARALIEIKEKILHYQILHEKKLLKEMMKDPVFSFEYLSEEKAQIDFVGGWVLYEDNTLNVPLYSAPVYGSIKMENGVLTFTSMDEEKTKLFIEKMKAFEHTLRFLHEEITVKHIREGVGLQTYSIRSESSVSPDLALHAQEVIPLHDQSIRYPFLHNLSLEEAVAKGYSEQVERWLRQREFNSFKLTNDKGIDKVTADYNTIRRQLGLAQSPFVTMRDKRQTKVIPIADPFAHPNLIEEDDIPFYEDLLFTPETAQLFFAADLVEFFKEKTLNKSEGTYYKYRTGLTTIASYFTTLSLSSWREVKLKHWQELLAYYYIDVNEDASFNQLKAVITSVKGFVKWLDKRYGTKSASAVVALVQELEPKLQNAITIWNYYVPSSQRRYMPSMLQTGLSVLAHMGERQEGMERGMFHVQGLTSTGMKVRSVEDERMYQVAIPVPLRKLLEKDMLIGGVILKGAGQKQWKLAAVERVFPADALECLVVEEVV